MRAQMAKLSRTRLLLLPLLFGLLVLPAFLRSTTAPATEDAIHSGSLCSNVEEVESLPLPEEDSSSLCLHCRAPMLDVPLARAVDSPAAGDAPPAA